MHTRTPQKQKEKKKPNETRSPAGEDLAKITTLTRLASKTDSIRRERSHEFLCSAIQTWNITQAQKEATPKTTNGRNSKSTYIYIDPAITHQCRRCEIKTANQMPK